MPLTPKQQRFVDEYLVDLNATQAAIRAGYSEKTARSVGSENLTKPDIAAAIAAAQAKLAEKTGITQERVLNELALIGFAHPGDYFEWGPDGVTLVPKDSLTAEQMAAVSEVSQTTSTNGGSIKLKLHDKVGALTKIGQHLGMFVERHELTGKNGGPIQTEVRARDVISGRIAGIAARLGTGEDNRKPDGTPG